MLKNEINKIIYDQFNDGNFHMHNENFNMEQELELDYNFK